MRIEKAFLKKRKDFIQWCIIAGIIISLFICLIDEQGNLLSHAKL